MREPVQVNLKFVSHFHEKICSFWSNLHHWQNFYTAAGSDGSDKYYLCCWLLFFLWLLFCSVWFGLLSSISNTTWTILMVYISLLFCFVCFLSSVSIKCWTISLIIYWSFNFGLVCIFILLHTDHILAVIFLCFLYCFCVFFFLSFDINFGNFREPKLCTVIVFIFFIESVEYNLSV